MSSPTFRARDIHFDVHDPQPRTQQGEWFCTYGTTEPKSSLAGLSGATRTKGFTGRVVGTVLLYWRVGLDTSIWLWCMFWRVGR